MFPDLNPTPVHETTMTQSRPGHYWIVCPTCGRVVLLIDEPFFCQCVVDGDATAIHRGGIGGVQIGGVEVRQ